MAMIDTERDVMVVRIVYDGAPWSGKTASLHALCDKLKTRHPVYDPTPTESRTQYFDWLDYKGGMFDNRPIACQILSVPGQPELQARREYVLRSADAVVFVLDARLESLALGLEYLRRLQALLASFAAPAPQLLIQANYQDAPSALTAAQLEIFVDSHLKILESIATTGQGIRESFVFAVRLATERAAALKALQQLPVGRPNVLDGAAFFEVFQAQSIATTPTTVLTRVLTAEILPEEETRPADTLLPAQLETVSLPAAEMPLRWTWPPFAGKALVQGLATQTLRTQVCPDDSWSASDPNAGWFCLSRPDWHYASLEQARLAMRQQSRQQARLFTWLPESRCVALSQAPDQSWHLWQVTHIPHSYAAHLKQVLQTDDAAWFTEQLLSAAHQVYQLMQRLAQQAPVQQFTLDRLAYTASDDSLSYGGLLAPSTDCGDEFARLAQLQTAFAKPIGRALDAALDIRATLHHFERLEPAYPQLAEKLAELFL